MLGRSPEQRILLTAPQQEVNQRLSVSLGTEDRMRWWTVVAAAGLCAAAVLALIGGFPLDMPMPEHTFGRVAPTCGLTRGSTAIARGDWALAWRYNPVSFLVMGFGALGLARLAIGTTTHRWVNIAWRPGPWAGAVAAALFVAWTIYQQTNAEFIITSRA